MKGGLTQLMKFLGFTFATDFWRSKTTYNTLAGLTYLVVQGCLHQMTWEAVGLGVFAALGVLFHRDASQKQHENALAVKGSAVQLDQVLQAHLNVNKSSIAAAVAAAVGTLITQVVQANEPAETEPRKPVQLSVVDGGPNTGVDANAPTTDAATEPHDGEADA
jgi:hypothetical protein